MAEKYLLVGKRHTKTKKGNDFFTYYLSRPFNGYENKNSVSALGSVVESAGCFDDFPCKPGDEVELVYDKGYQDKAVLSDIRVIKPHIK